MSFRELNVKSKTVSDSVHVMTKSTLAARCIYDNRRDSDILNHIDLKPAYPFPFDRIVYNVTCLPIHCPVKLRTVYCSRTFESTSPYYPGEAIDEELYMKGVNFVLIDCRRPHTRNELYLLHIIEALLPAQVLYRFTDRNDDTDIISCMYELFTRNGDSLTNDFYDPDNESFWKTSVSTGWRRRSLDIT